MQLVFRRIGADEVEKELTQRDQFNSDEVELIEALIREAHQNSLDARPLGSTAPIQTRLAFHTPDAEHLALLQGLLAPLQPHLATSGVDVTAIDFSSPRFLVIEDFGTTGLRGAWDRKDSMPFSDFWRRVGKSHKHGQQGGRWGLGKLVFSSASLARSFFGLTIRADDAASTPLLMGQAALNIHADKDGHDVDGVGFFCDPNEQGFQLPVRDRGLIDQFSEATGISRRLEPGLSIAIPFVRTDMGADGLIRELIRNYYFPILMGHLVSKIEKVEINETTFDALAQKHGGAQLGDGRVIAFIRELRGGFDAGKPDLVLSPDWTTDFSASLSEGDLQGLRARFAGGSLVHVRAPFALKHRKRGALVTFVDLFLRFTDGDGQGLVVRGGITLPLEGREFRSRKCLAALIARDEPLVEFLGDAENPAHTKWNANAEKLAANWSNASTRLREIRSALNSLYVLLAQSLEVVERDALMDVFSIPATAGDPAPKPKEAAEPGPVPPIGKRLKLFNIRRRRDGFVVAGDSGLTEDRLPASIRIRAAYDLSGANPFAKHSPLDFDFREPTIKVTGEGATWRADDSNELLIEATSPTFSVSVGGFDVNRDLVVRG